MIRIESHDLLRHLFLLGFSLVLVAHAARTQPAIDPDRDCCDHLFYRSMAYNLFSVTRPDLNEMPAGNRLASVYRTPYEAQWMDLRNQLNRQPPYCYRVITPLVARGISVVLRGDIDLGFRVLSFLSLVLACYFFAASIYLISGTILAAGLAAILFATSYWIVPFNCYDYMLTDPLAFCCLSLSVFLMLKGIDSWLLLVSLVGVFNKEIHFSFLACYLLRRLYERRLTPRSIVGVLGIVVAYGVFRMLFPVPINTFSLRSTFLGFPNATTVRNAAEATFGLLIYLVMSRIWISRFSLFLIPMALGAFVSSLFAQNVERAYIYAFPLVFTSILGIRIESIRVRLMSFAPIVFVWGAGWMNLTPSQQFAGLVGLEVLFLADYGLATRCTAPMNRMSSGGDGAVGVW